MDTSFLKKEVQFQWKFRHSAYVLLGILFLYVIGVVSDAPAPTPPTPSTPIVAQAFDIPTLVGKDMDEIRAILGTPDRDLEPTSLQIEFGTKEWTKEYERNGTTLLVTYEIATGRVIDLFVSKSSENTSDILATGNLSQKDANYSVEFVKALNTSGYTGAIVKAK